MDETGGRRLLELCAETLQGCMAACEGGADRIELCSALSEGGLTPSHGLIRQAVRESSLPVHVLLRPRGGNFHYSEAEFAVLCADLEHAAALGVAGVVVGMLKADCTVDLERTHSVVQLAGQLEVSFHRAFDQARNLAEALEDVIASGCGRLLTSGGSRNAVEGAPALTALAAQAGGRLRVAAGGGISLETAPQLLEIANNVDLHASLRSPTQKAERRGGGDPLWNQRDVISAGDVRAMARLLQSAAMEGVGLR